MLHLHFCLAVFLFFLSFFCPPPPHLVCFLYSPSTKGFCSFSWGMIGSLRDWPEGSSQLCALWDPSMSLCLSFRMRHNPIPTRHDFYPLLFVAFMFLNPQALLYSGLMSSWSLAFFATQMVVLPEFGHWLIFLLVMFEMGGSLCMCFWNWLVVDTASLGICCTLYILCSLWKPCSLIVSFFFLSSSFFGFFPPSWRLFHYNAAQVR